LQAQLEHEWNPTEGPLNAYYIRTGKLFTSAASGLDYVPYDNFPAMLHKGERVQTASEAAGLGGNNNESTALLMSVVNKLLDVLEKYETWDRKGLLTRTA
jgi:hypothetical protein